MNTIEPISNYEVQQFNPSSLNSGVVAAKGMGDTKVAWLAPVLSLIGSLGTTMINQVMSSKQNEKNLEYNSPAQQMKRYMEAGINPFQVVGNISSGNSSYMPPEVENPVPDVFNSLGQYQQLQNNILQNSFLEEKVRGLQLDNEYKSSTLNDRVGIIIDKSIQAYIKSLYDQGQLTAQQYDNQIKKWEKDYKDWYYNFKTTIQQYDSTNDTSYGLVVNPAQYLTEQQMQRNEYTNESVLNDIFGKDLRNIGLDTQNTILRYDRYMKSLEYNYMKNHGFKMGTADSKTALAIGAAGFILKTLGVPEETIRKILGIE